MVRKTFDKKLVCPNSRAIVIIFKRLILVNCWYSSQRNIGSKLVDWSRMWKKELRTKYKGLLKIWSALINRVSLALQTATANNTSKIASVRNCGVWVKSYSSFCVMPIHDTFTGYFLVILDMFQRKICHAQQWREMWYNSLWPLTFHF